MRRCDRKVYIGQRWVGGARTKIDQISMEGVSPYMTITQLSLFLSGKFFTMKPEI